MTEPAPAPPPTPAAAADRAAEPAVDDGLRLDGPVVLRGAALHVVLSLVPGVAVSILRRDDLDARSPLWLLAALALLLGPLVGGVFAARRRPDLALTHGAAAGACGASVLLFYGIGKALVQGEAPDVLSLLLLGIVQVSVAVVAAFLTPAPRRRSPPVEPERSVEPEQRAGPT